jgi:hypothetical protein
MNLKGFLMAGSLESSKRLYGLVCLLVAIIGFFAGKDTTAIGMFLGAATAVFIAQAASGT